MASTCTRGGVLLFDGETGEPGALVNASAVTAIRTAAVSAVATRALALPEARELALLGSGVQARAHLEAMAEVRAFERARVWSRTAEHARAFADETEAPFPVEPVESAEAAVRGADETGSIAGRRSADGGPVSGLAVRLARCRLGARSG